jgi:hypothetical protein
MRIFDINNTELTNPDLSCGYLINDKIFIKHHEAIEPIKEKWHYEVIKEYINGGKDVKKVVDVAGVEAKDAWDEYEDIYRYIEYIKEDPIDNQQSNINLRLDKIEETLLKITNFFNNYQEGKE